MAGRVAKGLCVALLAVQLAVLGAVVALQLAGGTLVAVSTPAMAPAVPEGSLAVTVACDPPRLQPGEVALVETEEGAELVRVEAQDGERSLTVGFDSASGTRSASYSEVTGRLAFSVPGLGGPARFFAANKAACVASLAVLDVGLVCVPLGAARREEAREVLA